jgi:PAS domain S-box-containing protein
MISEEKNLQFELKEQLRFETLLADLSARFINLPADAVDREIENAQRQIVEILGLDRSTLFQIVEGDDNNFVTTHSWAGPGLKRFPTVFSKEAFPWYATKIIRGEIVRYARIADLPPEAAKEVGVFRIHGPLSNVTFPLAINGEVFGALAFGALKAERKWSDLLVNRLRLVAEIFTSAIDRQRTNRALRESEARFRTVADSAPVLIWMAGTDQLCNFFNQPWLDYTGRTFDQEKGNGWAEGVHPDDVAGCLKTYQESFAARRPFVMQYRLKKQDGEYRWFLDHGVPRFDGRGNFAGYIGSCVDITDRKQHEEQLQSALAEVKQLKEQLHQENAYLRQEAKPPSHDKIAGQSPAIRRTLEQAEQVAVTGATVLLLGETGSGKELLAAAIHDRSPRRDRLMVRVNCAAIPTALIESELFGRERGAYTGALSKQIGRFELADKSTLFLDEIGELPAEVQVKLLRILQEKSLERLGSSKAIKVDVRIIAATNRNLEQAVREGRFREDLYYRLNVFPITVPPLRERREDLPQLVWSFVGEFSNALGKKIESVSSESMDAIQRYSWPGNVRELRNVIERAMILAAGPKLKIELPKSSRQAVGATARSLTIKDTERDHIRSVLEMTGWRIRGKNGAAEILEINPTTLESRMARLGIIRKRA